jgi:ribonuclease HI
VIVHQSGRYVGHGALMSNNVAEYSGFIDAILQVKKFPGPAIIKGDSKLVINHLLGKWKINGGLYMPFYEQARNLFAIERERLGLRWIPRKDNDECDVWSKKVLTDRGIRFRIQPQDGVSRSPFPITREEAVDDGYTLETENARCSGCDAVIDWWKTPREKRIPIDAGTFNPHWATCPKAESFRRTG